MPTAQLCGVGFIPDSPHSGGPVGLGCEGIKWRKGGGDGFGKDWGAGCCPWGARAPSSGVGAPGEVGTAAPQTPSHVGFYCN